MVNFKVLFILVAILSFSGCSSIYVDDGKTSLESSNDIGQLFSYSSNATMNSGDISYFMGCAQDTPIHFYNYDILASGNPISIEFYENPTFSSNGTLVNGLVMNRNYNNTPTLLLYQQPNVTNDGTKLFTRAILGSQNKDIGSVSGTLGWILERNTCYVFKVTNNNGNGVNIYNNFIWIEE